MFITSESDNKFKITDKGNISCVIQECHSLAFSDLYSLIAYILCAVRLWLPAFMSASGVALIYDRQRRS